VLFSSLRGPDDQRRTGGFDHIVGDKREFVDLEDALNLDEQPVQQAEVAAGYAGDGRDGLMVGEVRVIQLQAELSPVAGEHEGQFVILERAVMVGTSAARAADDSEI
jgi:hypothetical protein